MAAVPTTWREPAYVSGDLSTTDGVRGLLDNFNRCDEIRAGLIEILDSLRDEENPSDTRSETRSDENEVAGNRGETAGVGLEFY